MSPAERRLLRRLQARARRVSPRLARQQLRAYEFIRSLLTVSELEAALRSGLIERMLAELFPSTSLDPAFRPLKAAIDEALFEAARASASELPKRFAPTAFDILNPRVIDAARTLDGRFIDVLQSDVRDTVRQRAIAGLEAGLNPRRVARDVIDVIGLAPQQEEWVRNFRRELETGDRAALRRQLAKNALDTPEGKTITRRGHAGGAGLTERQLERLNRTLGSQELAADEIDRLVTTYRKRLEALNAEATSRTAALNSQKLGQRLSWEDAIERGVVDRNRLMRRWVDSGDSRVRPTHVEMDGETVRFDDRYSNGQLYPGDDEYNCRCIERFFVARSVEVPAPRAPQGAVAAAAG